MPMAEPARRLDVDERPCPRVVGATDDGKQLVTCGHLQPCPFHGAPLHVLQPPIDTTGGEGSE